jgi:hypothetical protein
MAGIAISRKLKGLLIDGGRSYRVNNPRHCQRRRFLNIAIDGFAASLRWTAGTKLPRREGGKRMDRNGLRASCQRLFPLPWDQPGIVAPALPAALKNSPISHDQRMAYLSDIGVSEGFENHLRPHSGRIPHGHSHNGLSHLCLGRSIVLMEKLSLDKGWDSRD